MADITSLAVGSTTVGANYQKAVTPFAYGIRELQWYKVQFTGVGTNPGNANSVYAQVLRGIQSVAEVHYSQTTAANFMVVAISKGTEETKTTDDALTNANAVADLEAAIEAVTGNGATVTTAVFQTS